jgi:hypothetical protein
MRHTRRRDLDDIQFEQHIQRGRTSLNAYWTSGRAEFAIYPFDRMDRDLFLPFPRPQISSDLTQAPTRRTESSLETLDRRVPSRSNPDPFDLDPEEVLDKLDILLTVLGQGFESGAFRNVGFPPGEGCVFDVDLGEEVKVGYETESEPTAGYRISINAETQANR